MIITLASRSMPLTSDHFLSHRSRQLQRFALTSNKQVLPSHQLEQAENAVGITSPSLLACSCSPYTYCQAIALCILSRVQQAEPRPLRHLCRPFWHTICLVQQQTASRHTGKSMPALRLFSSRTETDLDQTHRLQFQVEQELDLTAASEAILSRKPSLRWERSCY